MDPEKIKNIKQTITTDKQKAQTRKA